MILKRILCMTVASILGMGIVSYAASPVQHCFGVDHQKISWVDHSGKWSISELYTMQYTKSMHNDLNKMGYYNASYYKNNPASVIRTSIGSDAIFYISSHGGPGRVICPYLNTSTNKMEVSLLTAIDRESDPIALSLKSKYQDTTTQLKKVRLAYFGSCYSAKSAKEEIGWGNLLNRCIKLGVDCAIGFEDTVEVCTEAYFGARVITYYGSDSNNTINASVASAKRDTYNMFNRYGGVNSCVVKGNPNTKLSPAAYGVN